MVGKLTETIKNAQKSVHSSEKLSAESKQETSEILDNSPLILVAGGMVIGAIFAALLPKTERENKIMGDASRKLADGARIAADVAKSAGAAHLVEAGINSELLRDQAKDLLQQGVETAKSASKAAQEKIKSKDFEK